LQPQRDLLAQWLGKILGGSHADLSFLQGAVPQHNALIRQVAGPAVLFSRFNDPTTPTSIASARRPGGASR